jgi:hypothetical protein
MLGPESSCEIEQQPTGRRHIGAAVGALDDRVHPCPLALRQAMKDVAQPVDLAAFHEGDLAEEIAHGFFRSAFEPGENHEQTPVGAETAALDPSKAERYVHSSGLNG